MNDSSLGRAMQRFLGDEAAGSSVYYQLPWRKNNILFNLEEEVVFRNGQKPVNVEAVCGIVGQLNTGRKHLGYRFGKMNEQDIGELSNELQLCYSCNFDTVIQCRPIEATIKAYIIPPPGTDQKQKERQQEVKQQEKVPLYVQASPQFCCLLFTFDVTRSDSFDTALNCIRNMKISLPGKYFLVGNKCDLRGTVAKGKEVPEEFARTQAKKLGAFGYFECSAKRNVNVRSIMQAIVKCEYDRPHV